MMARCVVPSVAFVSPTPRTGMDDVEAEMMAGGCKWTSFLCNSRDPYRLLQLLTTVPVWVQILGTRLLYMAWLDLVWHGLARLVRLVRLVRAP